MFITKLNILIVLLVLQKKFSDAIKCYSCGDAGNNILYSSSSSSTLSSNSQDNILLTDSCHTLNDYLNSSSSIEVGIVSDQLEKFIIDCPIEYHGCITQIQGNQVIRTCDTYPMDDCQTANGITYCYCSYDLCNAATNDKIISSLKDKQLMEQPFQTKPPETISIINMTDDEDYDMSGNGINEEDDNNEDEFPHKTDDFEENSTTINFIKSKLPVVSSTEVISHEKTVATIKVGNDSSKDSENEISIDDSHSYGDPKTTETSGKHISIISATTEKTMFKNFKNKSNSIYFNWKSMFVIICLKLKFN